MKISSIRVVDLDLPHGQSISKPRRAAWYHSTLRALPLSKYPEYANPRIQQPGTDETPVWVQVTAEDGTWGLGACGFGSVSAAMIAEVFAPPPRGSRLFRHRAPQRPDVALGAAARIRGYRHDCPEWGRSGSVGPQRQTAGATGLPPHRRTLSRVYPSLRHDGRS